MRLLFTFILLGSFLSVFSQEDKVFFDDAISEHLISYNKLCDIAIKNEQIGHIEVLFDSLKKTYLKGTVISNLRLKKLSGGYLNTEKISLPIILITKKSCIVTNREEIKAINEIANQYKGKVKCIVLYWDKKRLAKKATKGYNKNITIAYMDERDNRLDHALSSIKNSFGVPACFYITQQKELSNIDRKFYLKNLKRNTKKEFYENTYKDITQLLLENETSKMESVTSN